MHPRFFPRAAIARVRGLGLGVALAVGLAACGTTPDIESPAAATPPMPSTSTSTGTAPVTPMTWGQLSGLPVPATPVAERFVYGAAPQQFLQLRLPPGASARHPAPLVWLLHGGCWQNEYTYAYFEPLAAWLATRGYATANVEFRRIGDPGGGWPGTFDDLQAAVASLPTLAARHPGLDATRTIAVGHSAGGHLALWLMQHDLTTRGAVGLAAIADLTAYGANAAPGSCGASVAALLGGGPRDVPERYQATDPARHRPVVPAGQQVVLLTGGADAIVPRGQAEAFIAERADHGAGPGRWVELPGLGHFDMAAPEGPAGQALLAALGDLGR